MTLFTEGDDMTVVLDHWWSSGLTLLNTGIGLLLSTSVWIER